MRGSYLRIRASKALRSPCFSSSMS
jgi:hypothetical protein